ncbi:MAG: hypothetical protein U1D30_21695 [Planctomycetota bacterium]
MSGPIVRSYGVPNWDEIFGNQEGEKEPKAAKKKSAKKAPAPKGAKATKKTKRK